MSHIRDYNNRPAAPNWDHAPNNLQEQRIAHSSFFGAKHGGGSNANDAHSRWLALINSSPDGPFGHQGPPYPQHQGAENNRQEGQWPPSGPQWSSPGHRYHHRPHSGGPWGNTPGHGGWGAAQGGWGGPARQQQHPAAGFWQMNGPAFNHPGAAGAWADNRHDDMTATPEVDVYDTAQSFVVCVSLPGMKRDEVKVSWNQKMSELSIVGVLRRQGGEEFLKTLALDERRVGPFDRKVRLGSPTNPAQVDAISAKMEDGILTIEVQKLEAAYTQVKAIDIE